MLRTRLQLRLRRLAPEASASIASSRSRFRRVRTPNVLCASASTQSRNFRNVSHLATLRSLPLDIDTLQLLFRRRGAKPQRKPCGCCAPDYSFDCAGLRPKLARSIASSRSRFVRCEPLMLLCVSASLRRDQSRNFRNVRHLATLRSLPLGIDTLQLLFRRRGAKPQRKPCDVAHPITASHCAGLRPKPAHPSRLRVRIFVECEPLGFSAPRRLCVDTE